MLNLIVIRILRSVKVLNLMVIGSLRSLKVLNLIGWKMWKVLNCLLKKWKDVRCLTTKRQLIVKKVIMTVKI